MKTIHLNQKENKCETCWKCFRYKGDLFKHVKTIHLNQKENKCETYEKCFVQEQNLLKYVKTIDLNHYCMLFCVEFR